MLKQSIKGTQPD